MCPHALNRVVATFHFGDDGVVIVAVKPSAVADLSAGFGVERRVVEDDLAFFARLEFLRALPVVDDGENFAAIGAGLAVAFEVGLRKLLVGRIRSLLGRAFPGSASALALLLHGAIETLLIESDALVPRCILHEVQRHAERVVELEAFSPEDASRRLHARLDEVSSSFFSPISSVCANRVLPTSTVFETRSADSFSSGYASCIRSRTAKTISYRNGLSGRAIVHA